MRNYTMSRILSVVFFSAALLYIVSVSRVDATPILVIDGILRATDQGAGDTNNVPGNVAFAGTIGSFIVSVGGATGTANAPDLTLAGTALYSGMTAGTIQIAINETGYSATDIKGFDFDMSGLITIGTATVVYDYYIGVDNNMDWTDGDTLMSTLAGPPFGGTDFYDLSSLSPSSRYALTIVATINTPGFSFTNFGAEAKFVAADVKSVVQSVPEPATIALLGIGLVGLCGGGYIRRRIKKQSRKV